MSWNKAQGKGATQAVTIRLDPLTADFYRRKASLGGVALSTFLRNTLHEGVIAENVQDIEDRMRALLATIPESARDGNKLPDDVLMALFTCEALLIEIVNAQNIQVFYRAQDTAKAKLAKRKEVPT